jgi:putative transposase
MPPTASASAADYCYHVLNRGNACAEGFRKPADYEAFLERVAAACARLSVRVLGYCPMPNHVHLVLRPFRDGDLSRWMQWFLTTHVRRYRRHYGSSGHVWLGRFRAFPCQDDEHLLTVLRDVERNALRAGIVRRAEEWPFGSLHTAVEPGGPAAREPGPLPGDKAWIERVNRPMSEAELAAVRQCVESGMPYDSEAWTKKTALTLGLESSLRPRGRPKKQECRTAPFLRPSLKPGVKHRNSSSSYCSGHIPSPSPRGP